MLLLTVGLLLIAGVISFLYFQYNDGGVLNLDLAGHTGSIPMAWITYAIAGLIVFLLALWLLGKVFSVPRRIRHRGTVRGMRKSRESLDKGLMQIQTGEFANGEKVLTSYLDGGSGDAVKYLTAAKAAQQRGAEEQAEVYLKKASDASNEASAAVRTTQAELMLQRGNFKDAETLLENLHLSAPRNAHLMTMLATAMQGNGNADGLTALVRAMRARTQLPMSYIEPLEESAWQQQIQNASDQDLHRTWDALSGEARKKDSVIAAYANRMRDFGEDNKAETLLQRSLQQKWSDSLVTIYGDLEPEDTVKQLENAESWLKEHPRSAALQLAAGKISAKRQLWGKAKEKLMKSAELDLNPDVCLQLGEVLEQMGDSHLAKDCFRSAANLATGKSAVGALLDTSNLSQAMQVLKAS